MTYCFLTKREPITTADLSRVVTEFEKNNFQVVTKERLGLGGVVLKLHNFVPTDFQFLEKELKLDLNFNNYRIKLQKMLVADMDSTIINCECIDELAFYSEHYEKVMRITKKTMSGDLSFDMALKQRVKLLKGLRVQQLNDCYHKKIKINPGVRTLVKTMRSLGAVCAIISGGFSFFAERVAAETGFEKVYANKLIFADGMLTGAVETPILDQHQKKKILHELCSSEGVSASDVIAVGDGANDIDMVKKAGLGVSYFGKHCLTVQANFKIYYSDFRALLYFQGVKEIEFVSDV